jgi:hypothetical protein
MNGIPIGFRVYTLVEEPTRYKVTNVAGRLG